MARAVPVCVTPLEMIDQALDIAARPNVIFCSFGDMLRVPGCTTDLLSIKARGGDVRIVYSPFDAVKVAEQNPAKEVVFFAVGFETTAPAKAMAVYQARRRALRIFPCLCLTCSCRRRWKRCCRRRMPRAGISGRRPCLHGDGLRGIPAHRRQISSADRGHRIRAAGYPAGGANGVAAIGSRPCRGGKPIHARCAQRRQPPARN